MNMFKSFCLSLAKKGAGASQNMGSGSGSNFKSAPAPAKKPRQLRPALQHCNKIGTR